MEKMTTVNENPTTLNLEELDQEWLKLIAAAKKLGITKEEIRRFLQNNKY